jgi:hypothetical protein
MTLVLPQAPAWCPEEYIVGMQKKMGKFVETVIRNALKSAALLDYKTIKSRAKKGYYSGKKEAETPEQAAASKKKMEAIFDRLGIDDDLKTPFTNSGGKQQAWHRQCVRDESDTLVEPGPWTPIPPQKKPKAPRAPATAEQKAARAAARTSRSKASLAAAAATAVASLSEAPSTLGVAP